MCNLRPNKDQERLDIEILDEQKCKEKGFVYIFVIKNKIFKIGQSITNIKGRIQSYNCGKVEYRINGTNSTTNYFVLQSLLSINELVEVYAFFPPKPTYIIFGQSFTDSYPPSKKAENIIIKKFKEEHKKLPIGCTQT
ncbi:restriction endonuclease [Campylobacter sp. MIT 99-7217]|nr:restriction endonuclease [Campylobacter sp. MIT 99-7217]